MSYICSCACTPHEGEDKDEAESDDEAFQLLYSSDWHNSKTSLMRPSIRDLTCEASD